MASDLQFSKFFRFYDYATASNFAAFAGWTAALMGLSIDVERKGWSIIIAVINFTGSDTEVSNYFDALDRSPPTKFYEEFILGG